MVVLSDRRLYPGWHRVVDRLRNDRPTVWDPAEQVSPFGAEDPVMVQMFWEAMHGMSISTARACDGFAGHARLFDVGAGLGSWRLSPCRSPRPERTA